MHCCHDAISHPTHPTPPTYPRTTTKDISTFEVVGTFDRKKGAMGPAPEARGKGGGEGGRARQT